MSTKLTWLGHGCWQINAGDDVILLDPFLDDSPTAPVKSADIECQFILVSHGHFDHISDVPQIAQRTGAQVIAVVEVAEWLKSHRQVENTVGMNIGGLIDLAWGSLKLTPAWHSSSMPDGSYGGQPVGFLLNIGGVKIYFACDTALFRDMELIGEAELDVAVLPIGDHYTMGPEDSFKAIKYLKPRHVIPTHYNTWPPISQDVEMWAEEVKTHTSAWPVVLEPGDHFEC